MKSRHNHPEQAHAETLRPMLGSTIMAGHVIESDAICVMIADHHSENKRVGAYHLHSPGHCTFLPQMLAWLQGPESPFDDRLFSANRGGTRLIPPDADKRKTLHTRFAPCKSLGGATDAINLRSAISPSTRCSTIYLRCDGHRPFDEDNIGTLDRLSPAIESDARYFYGRYLDEVSARGAEKSGHDTNAPFSKDQLKNRLSRTESAVLEYLLTTQTERDIAETMNRSPNTIHVHVKSIYRKLRITSRRELKALIK